MKVCIIGAGASGLVSAKVLRQQSIDYDWFELGSDIGGNWRYGNDNGRSSAYASLHIDTSKERMRFSDFPMPEEWPHYLHHSQVLEYFESYAEHFRLKPRVTFRTRVEQVTPGEAEGTWDVTATSVDGGTPETRTYDAVLVANGHHWNPSWPDFPGTFTGEVIHSHDYRTPDVLVDKDVIVVGIGNSGTDIAVEAAQHARSTVLSTRRSAYILPRWFLGRPTDSYTSPTFARLPLWLQRIPYRAMLLAARGRQASYGVPIPRHKLLEEHPTMSQELLQLVRDGKIIMKPNIERLDNGKVRFADGTASRADLVIYATGYRISFPFLSDDVLTVKDNVIPLYRKVIHPDRPGLFFMGLIQPLGAIMPLVEQQAEWVARLLRGAPVPSRGEMHASIAEDQDGLRRRYVDVPRHTIQVDYFPYLRLMQREVDTAAQALASRSG
ncbi:MAG: NAD(P)-binding domain-containing protein [Acidimicrobiia bacterium]|nr:NAD(P)-binding domain-containing protein [Acidimicrobiia bacterium]